ncbi:MAG TPA: low molecular weight protein-tyrosine-phosphatase [Capsulimonadaceae bacterium]
MEKKPVKVLFVCLGNICRSPMAEGVFQHLVAQAGLSSVITTDSAGTGSWHVGNQPHEGTRQILKKNAIDYRHAARTFRVSDFTDFDYILTMDDDNLATVKRVGSGRAVLRPFLDFAPHLDYTEVPDPYYTGNFGEVFDIVNAAAAGLLREIRREHSL